MPSSASSIIGSAMWSIGREERGVFAAELEGPFEERESSRRSRSPAAPGSRHCRMPNRAAFARATYSAGTLIALS